MVKILYDRRALWIIKGTAAGMGKLTQLTADLQGAVRPFQAELDVDFLSFFAPYTFALYFYHTQAVYSFLAVLR